MTSSLYIDQLKYYYLSRWGKGLSVAFGQTQCFYPIRYPVNSQSVFTHSVLSFCLNSKQLVNFNFTLDHCLKIVISFVQVNPNRNMSFILALILVSIFYGLYLTYHRVFGPKALPWIDGNQYWGEKPNVGKHIDSSIIESFEVSGMESNVLSDLRQELLNRRVKMSQPLIGVGSEYGVNSIGFQRFLGYWADDYLPRWVERQNILNKFPQYTTEVQGYDIRINKVCNKRIV